MLAVDQHHSPLGGKVRRSRVPSRQLVRVEDIEQTILEAEIEGAWSLPEKSSVPGRTGGRSLLRLR